MKLCRRQTWMACLLLLSAAPSVCAQQLAFDKQLNDGQYQFHYRWRDSNQQSYDIRFAVDRDEFFQPFEKYRSYQRERANRELRYRLNRYFQQQRWSRIYATLSPREQTLSIEYQGRLTDTLKEHLQQAQSYYQQQWQDYLEANYYRQLNLPLSAPGIIPDHLGIARAVTPKIAPLARAFNSILGDNTQRNYLDLLASFVQSIPYNPLTDDSESRGQGYEPPAQLLANNQGDCDSKATLMLALVRQIMPNVSAAIVYLPKHALVAVSVTQRSDDETLDDSGYSYVLIEVAGPALMPAGQIAEDSKLAISRNQYQVAPL
ncbi:hypothetical protein CWI84_03690 [Idiomarina tyrosinivorans]|uniref:Transglutaminase-like domain-containing protein n=1 Tax=Idiomarina tyrosinivorans TaxID=1445662 RepID=A0A432ZS24_9GAMM|nr:hypothetical protein [Idiomarina tyrosinivorans]RUO80697.1 hypothetical protein CWI84_03690 [Idiomarina tyrosinivorans]